MVIRQIPFKIKTFDELQLPAVIADGREAARAGAGDRPHGLGQVHHARGDDRQDQHRAAGTSSRSKTRSSSSTGTSNCIVNQREVGTDTKSFASALKYALREDPDVILIGEMRDLETIQAALTIAETGHLVFATLHTNSAAEAINRIIDVFPSHQQSQVRAQLAFVLEGIITQTLLPKRSGRGRAMAAEILVVTPAIRALIRDDKVHQIYSLMQSGKKFGMQTLNDALYQLYISRQVSAEECLRASGDPNEFLRMIGKSPSDDRPGRGPAAPAVGAARPATAVVDLHPVVCDAHVHVHRPHAAASSSRPRSTPPRAMTCRAAQAAALTVVKVDEDQAEEGAWQASIKMRDIVIFTRQFSTMINAGLPLVQALDILARRARTRRWRDGARRWCSTWSRAHRGRRHAQASEGVHRPVREHGGGR
jgi:hypothetical protein